MKVEQINKLFTYRPPTESQIMRIETIRNGARHLAHTVNAYVYDGPGKEKAIDWLSLATMTAIRSIIVDEAPVQIEIKSVGETPLLAIQQIEEEIFGKILDADFNPEAENMARRFHELYEQKAPEFGYETRKESAVPWDEVPEANRRLMIAVCRSILQERVRNALEDFGPMGLAKV